MYYGTNYSSPYSQRTLPSSSYGYGAASSRLYTPMLQPINESTYSRIYNAPYQRPLNIDTSKFDLTSPRNKTEKYRPEATYGTIHRGRTVVRLSNKKEQKATKTPGELLVEKFTIKDTKDNHGEVEDYRKERQERLARGGVIKRHTSIGIKVPQLTSEDETSDHSHLTVVNNIGRRKSEEMIKIESDILDSLVLQELSSEELDNARGRRRSSGALLPLKCKSKKFVSRKTKSVKDNKNDHRKLVPLIEINERYLKSIERSSSESSTSSVSHAIDLEKCNVGLENKENSLTHSKSSSILQNKEILTSCETKGGSKLQKNIDNPTQIENANVSTHENTEKISDKMISERNSSALTQKLSVNTDTPMNLAEKMLFNDSSSRLQDKNISGENHTIIKQKSPDPKLTPKETGLIRSKTDVSLASSQESKLNADKTNTRVANQTPFLRGKSPNPPSFLREKSPNPTEKPFFLRNKTTSNQVNTKTTFGIKLNEEKSRDGDIHNEKSESAIDLKQNASNENSTKTNKAESISTTNTLKTPRSTPVATPRVTPEKVGLLKLKTDVSLTNHVNGINENLIKTKIDISCKTSPRENTEKGNEKLIDNLVNSSKSLKNSSDDVIKTTRETLDKLTKTSQDVAEKIIKTLEDTTENILKTPRDTPDKLIKTPRDTPDKIIKTTRDTPDKLIKTPRETPDKIIKTPIETLDKVIKTPRDTPDKLIKTPRETPDKIIKTTRDTPDKLIKTPRETPDKIIKTPIETLDKVIKTPRDTPDKLIKTPRETPDKIIKTPIEILDKVIKTPRDTPDKLIKTPRETPDKIIKTPIEILDKVIKTPRDTPDKLIKTPRDTPDKLLKTPRVTPDKVIKSSRDGTPDKLIKAPRDTPDKLIITPRDTPDKVIKTPRETPDKLIKTPRETPDKLIKTPRDTPDKVIITPRDTPDTVIITPRDTPDKVILTPRDTPDKFIKTPRETPDKLLKTPRVTPDKVIKAPRDTPDKIIKAARETPDKVMKTPRDTPDKFIKTLRDTPDRLIKTSEDVEEKLNKTPVDTPDKIIKTPQDNPDKLTKKPANISNDLANTSEVVEAPKQRPKTARDTPEKNGKASKETPDKLTKTPKGDVPDKSVNISDNISQTPGETSDKLPKTARDSPDKTVNAPKENLKNLPKTPRETPDKFVKTPIETSEKAYNTPRDTPDKTVSKGNTENSSSSKQKKPKASEKTSLTKTKKCLAKTKKASGEKESNEESTVKKKKKSTNLVRSRKEKEVQNAASSSEESLDKDNSPKPKSLKKVVSKKPKESSKEKKSTVKKASQDEDCTEDDAKVVNEKEDLNKVKVKSNEEEETSSSGNENTSSEEEYSSSSCSCSCGMPSGQEDGGNFRTSTSSNDSGISSNPSRAACKQDCDVNCHRKCEKLMPNLCGVNQKLVVEALTSLKRDTSTPPRRLSNKLSLDNGETSHHSKQCRHSRATPSNISPATTIPRFRKYDLEDFQLLKVLGKGSFGKVFLAELKGTEYYYAVKCLKKDVVLEDDDVECTLIERKVLALGTKHPYLCHLFCTFQTDSHLFFVMEYLNGGDLMFHIQQSGRFEESRARFYAAEIVSGMRFLHKKGIVYRDLKLDNILLDYEGHVRIADFGMCKLQIYLDKTTDTFCGTPDYMAPEIIKGLKYNQCVDWWSFGILLYEMHVGQSPFSGCDEDELFWSICNERPRFPQFLSVEAKNILLLLLDKDTTKRLGSTQCNSGDDVVAHEYFRGLDWHALERREIKPSFKPKVLHALDVKYFDTSFTTERPLLTPIEKTILESMDQTQFQGFSYTNPNATDP